MTNLKFHLNKDFEQVAPERQLELREQVEFLKKQPQPEQRTQLWYDMRNGMVTACYWVKILGYNPFSNVNELILKKCGHERPFPDNPAIRWGVKYEDVAIQIYEARNNTKVIEYGLIQHPEFKYLGASPDGITDDGVMVEIKCPSKRQITGKPPVYYYDQVQGQLEVCKLDRCDFLECKLAEYDEEDDYFEENYEGDYTKTKDNKEKGFTLEFLNKKTKKYKFEFGPLGVNKEEVIKWTNKILEDKYKNDTEYIYAGPSFWKLIEVSCIPIYRDQEWFKEAHIGLKKFWDTVSNYRENGGVEELLKPKKEKPIYISTNKYVDTSMIDYLDDKKTNLETKLNSNKKYLFSEEEINKSKSSDMPYMFSEEKLDSPNIKNNSISLDVSETNTTDIPYMFSDDSPSKKKNYNSDSDDNIGDIPYMFSDETPIQINKKVKTKKETVYLFSE
jgi:putative phage-type endonuclease